MKFEQKNCALSSNGYNFPLMVRRSIREFVEHDEQDGFFLSRFTFKFNFGLHYFITRFSIQLISLSLRVPFGPYDI